MAPPIAEEHVAGLSESGVFAQPVDHCSKRRRQQPIRGHVGCLVTGHRTRRVRRPDAPTNIPPLVFAGYFSARTRGE